MEGRPLRIPLTGALTLAVLSLSRLATPAYAIPGDLDLNGTVDNNDARLALQIAAGTMPASALSMAAGDVAPAGSPDGKITIFDAARIIRAAHGLDDLGGGGAQGAHMLSLIQSVTIAGNLTKDYKLAGGFLVKGTVKNTAGQSITESVNPFNSKSGSISFSGPAGYDSSSVAATTGNYSVVLPAGTFTPQVFTNFGEVDATSGAFFYYSLPSPTSPTLAVNADTTKDYIRPDLPAAVTTTGNITASNFNAESATLSMEQGNYAIGSSDGTSYIVKSASGQGRLGLSGTYADNPDVNAAVTFGTPLTAGSAHDVTVATLYPVTGTVTTTGGAVFDYIDFTSMAATGDVYSSSYSTTAGENTYTLAVPPGTYRVGIDVSSTSPQPQLSFGASYTATAASQSKDFTLPAIPANFTFTGTVTGPDNKPVVNASLSMSSTAPVAGGWDVYQSGETDATGKFSLLVPAGSYSLIITPPTSP